ncbi:hypothetical protein SESBI_17741 [Sesbania bispinosa]|nr:hypothetical protein SESBI_17741 [Sesbania bispinosa]
MAISTASSSSSKGWTKNVSTISAHIFFLLIIFQIPLFRVTCRSGVCTTPLHVTSSQLIASEIFPVPIVKGLLYPGAAAKSLIHNMTIPSWDSLLDLYNLTGAKEAPAATDLQRLEVLAGSYFSVAGALVGKPVNSDPSKAVYVYPTMVLAMICAFSSVKYDVKKVVRPAPIRSTAKPLSGLI